MAFTNDWMHKHIALGSPSITFNLIGQTMEGAFEGAFGLVGLSSALDIFVTALSTRVAFPDIPTSQGFYEGDVFLDHSLDHHPGLVFLTIYSY